MYNKTKRGLDLAASILSIILGAIFSLACLISLGELESYSLIYEDKTAFFVAIFTLFALAVLLIVLSAILCKKPIKIKGVFQKRKALNILLLIELAIFTFLLLLIGEIFIIFIAISGTALAFKITTFCLKSEIEEQSETQAVPFTSIDEKIKELQHLKELGAITEEQYTAALDKIVKNFNE